MREVSRQVRFFVFILVVAFPITLFIEFQGAIFLATLGIRVRDGSAVSVFVSIPTFIFFMILGEHLFLKAALPSLRQAFTHPRNATKPALTKIMILVYLSMGLLLYLINGNSLQSLISVGLIILGLYALVVLMNVYLQMAKDERVQHPFR